MHMGDVGGLQCHIIEGCACSELLCMPAPFDRVCAVNSRGTWYVALVSPVAWHLLLSLFACFLSTQIFGLTLRIVCYQVPCGYGSTLRYFLHISPPRTDAVEDYREEAGALVAALLDANALELLVQRLGSLDEKV